MAVSVEEALEIIYKNISPKSIKILPMEQSLGFVLAQDVVASHNLPPFDNSAMDGYAVKISDAGKDVKVVHTIFAGDNSDAVLEEGFGIKIMTGARVLQGCECIVPVEDTTSTEDGVRLPENLVFSRHIRFAGEDIKAGDWIVLEVFKTIDPTAHVQIYNDMFIKNYVTALIKQQWGQNLIKFEGMVLPGGVTLNGRQIYDDATEDIEKLVEAMRLEFEAPMSIFIG